MSALKPPLLRKLHRWPLLLLLLASTALAGGYVDGNVVLRPATAINTGAASITPTFNNDPVRTPSTTGPVSPKRERP